MNMRKLTRNVAILAATPAHGLQVRVGSLSVHDGGAASVRQLYRQGSGTVTVTFNGGVLKPTSDTTGTYATEFIKSLNDLNIGVGGMAIQTTGKNLGMKDCTVKVVPGGRITITGGGTFTFSNATLRLTAKPTAGRYVFAETDGTLSGLPTFDDTFETGRQLKMSADGKCLYLAPRGVVIIIKKPAPTVPPPMGSASGPPLAAAAGQSTSGRRFAVKKGKR